MDGGTLCETEVWEEAMKPADEQIQAAKECNRIVDKDVNDGYVYVGEVK